jgi:thymidylate synthase
LTIQERIEIAGYHLSETALDALGIPEFGFELHWNQRSVDTFLGLPFNIASYGLLAKILEQVTGYKALAIEGTLKCVHFYDNQYEAVEELLKRDPNKHEACEVELSEAIGEDLDEILHNYKISDFKLIGYKSDEEIKVEMLAPTKL